MKYWVCFEEYVAMRGKVKIWSGFIDSELQTTDEVKNKILEHHRKKKVKGIYVTVIKGDSRN